MRIRHDDRASALSWLGFALDDDLAWAGRLSQKLRGDTTLFDYAIRRSTFLDGVETGMEMAASEWASLKPGRPNRDNRKRKAQRQARKRSRA